MREPARIDADNARREGELASTKEIVAKLEQTVPIAKRRVIEYFLSPLLQCKDESLRER